MRPAPSAAQTLARLAQAEQADRMLAEKVRGICEGRWEAAASRGHLMSERMRR